MSQLTPQQTARMTASRLSNAVTPLLIFFAELIPSSLLVLFLLGAAAAIGARWPSVGLPLYGILIVLSLVFALRGRRDADALRVDETVNEQRVWSALIIGRLVVPCTVAFVLCCGQFFRAWQSLFGGFAVPAGAGYWEWVLYSLSWVLDNTLANAAQIFDWNLTSVHPVSLGAQLLILGYNLVLEFFLLALVFRLARVLLRLTGRDIVIGNPRDRW
jgi:hypothetical protein